MTRCSHGKGSEGWDNVITIGATVHGEYRSVRVEVCWKCGHWLPLGPANDKGVEVEIRAAELAGRKTFGSFHDCGRGCERCGYVVAKHATSGDAPTAHCDAEQFHAGYLARCIVETGNADE